jgi:hypothetical protein
MKSRRIARALIAVLILLPPGIWAKKPDPGTSDLFMLRFNPAGIESLKRTDDTYDTEYIQKGETLGHVLVRYRLLAGPWQEFSTKKIDKTRCKVKISSNGDGKFHHFVVYNESGWDDYFADLEFHERFKVEGDALYWTLHFRNLTHKPLELGDVILPLPFNSEPRWDKIIMYTQRVIPHRFISGHGSFLYWMRPNSEGPYLVMVPVAECPLFESSRNERNFKPAKLEYSDQRGVYIHSVASLSSALAKGGTWRQSPTSATLTPKFSPDDEISYMFKFRWADDYNSVRDILYEEGLFDIQVVPGMTVPADLEVMLSLRTKNTIGSIIPEFPEQTRIQDQGEKAKDTRVFKITFSRLGENKLTINFGKAQTMILEFFITEPLETLMKKRAVFLVHKQQHRDPGRWYNGLFSEWDMRHHVLRSPDDTDGLRRYVLSCDDPGLCKAPYIAAKNAAYPSADEVEAVEYYLEHFVWGKLQCTDQEQYPYAIYGIPDWKVNRESSPSDREGWTGHVWRVFDYPHVIHLYWSMYRVAKYYPNLTKYLDADGYLERAFGTAKAYFTIPLRAANWSALALGNYDEAVIPHLIEELEAKGWGEKAEWLQEQWNSKVEHFINEGPNLFHSEYPYDPTGFESYQAFARHAVEESKNKSATLIATDKDMNVSFEDALKFMEEEIALNIAARGWLETAYYLLGGERALRYMSQMGGWAILDYGIYYAQDPTDYLRLGYASFLSSWALMNSGTPESNYGFWYPGPENDGAAGSAFVMEAFGRTWLGKEQRRGPWFYSCEIDLGYGAALRTAATVVMDDPLFGLIALGGSLIRSGNYIDVIPRDGLRQRFHAILRGTRFHMLLERDGFSSKKPIRFDDSLGEISFTLENRSGDDHLTFLDISGLPPGHYELRCDGRLLLAFDSPQLKDDMYLPLKEKKELEVLVKRIN